MRHLICLVFALPLLATPAVASDPAESCGHQAAIVSALQSARRAWVKEPQVAVHILREAHSWPDTYDAAIPLIAPWVYEQSRRTLRTQDLSAAWLELCLAQS